MKAAPPPPFPTSPTSSEPQKMAASGMRVLKIVGWVCAVLGLAMMLFGVFFLRDGYRSSSWPSVEGTVMKSGVRVHPSVSARRSISTHRGRQDDAEVTYRYQTENGPHVRAARLL